MRSSEKHKPSEARARRRKRVALVLLAGAVGIGLLHPETFPELAILSALVLAVLFWPAKARRIEPETIEVRRDPALLDPGAQDIVTALAEPVLVVDRNLTLKFQNPASLAPLGPLRSDESITLRFRAPHVISAIEDAIATGQRTSTLFDERRGAERSFQIEVLPIPRHDGVPPVFFLIIFYDRTAARATERIRTDFVANASHELRTPLASLIGFIETLQGPAKDDAGARERFLEIMRDQAGRMSRLIDDLLSLSRIEMKRHLPVSEPVDLGDTLKKVGDQLAPLARQMSLVIELDLGAEPARVAGDADELIQVFSNLVENACKYGRSGGRVILRLRTGEEHGRPIVDASVVDFGPGIPIEHQPRLTERFYRVDVGSSRAMKGTGLGLAIVRNILLRHKARLLVQSEPGHGATFTTRFGRLS
ncbi:ATP-binding protein [Fulvimarina sp. 2208YS6-2-32]|uniref:histidine kinase n=1 Tax=Fulvimarina uroteuthidis TaxID=3098149 RepID=A0ABU5HZT6_9HYPH|nr:ATP-binding protein [Fulvimarina sp. 2208YS6-2-32]MDY8108644.1 ATP-binding protein [Fulvimarina sp. 2208YS6-2-32]